MFFCSSQIFFTEALQHYQLKLFSQNLTPVLRKKVHHNKLANMAVFSPKKRLCTDLPLQFGKFKMFLDI